MATPSAATTPPCTANARTDTSPARSRHPWARVGFNLDRISPSRDLGLAAPRTVDPSYGLASRRFAWGLTAYPERFRLCAGPRSIGSKARPIRGLFLGECPTEDQPALIPFFRRLLVSCVDPIIYRCVRAPILATSAFRNTGFRVGRTIGVLWLERAALRETLAKPLAGAR
jgi:hypothetical protein